MKKYISFEKFSYQEKKDAIFYHITKNTSTEFIHYLIENNELEITDCTKYRRCVGCPVVYLGKPNSELNKNQNKALGRTTYRQINEKFPLLELVRVLRRMYSESTFSNIPLDKSELVD